jgi:hypothetical protein
VRARGKFQGVVTIARFNWPFYVAAIAFLITSGAGFFLFPGLPLKLIFGSAFGGAAYFLVGSLGVSYFVYDRSDLYRWGWLDRALSGVSVHRAIYCHCGFDEASAGLRERFRDAAWCVLDHYEPDRMTETSIRRARAAFPSTPGTLPSRYDTWPVAAESVDVVFGLLAIHELRSEAERSAWFAESRRSLRKGGRVVLVEHVRDRANVLAFGPGFLHFHPTASWRRCGERAGLRLIDQFCVTPFVQVFILSTP